jgi:phage FluMu protein gp41
LRPIALALPALAGLALLAAEPVTAALEPVIVTVTAPPVVASKARFAVAVAVTADPGALAIAHQPLRLRVKLAPECGGSYAGTDGPVLIDRALPAPALGSAYETEQGAAVSLAAFGTETVCAFVEDAEERQFATSTEGTVTVSRACTVASRDLSRLQRRARHLRQRLAKLRRGGRHAQGKRRVTLKRKVRKLKRKRHRVSVQLRRAQRAGAGACEDGGG